MDFSFIETKTLLLIVHLIGLALGVGGALMSDLMFFRAIRDKEITPTEMDFLTLASRCVTIGLFILILSGVGLFFLDTERYLASSKFLVKMTIVLILTLNGVLFHLIHIPHLKSVAGNRVPLLYEFSKRRWLFLGSGVVSVVSWLSALILGVFKSVPLSYEVILDGYGILLIIGFIVAFLLRNRLLPIR
ncbi:MAG TPA: hypothetical protein VI957_00280 [Candidatus Paceibacterota bacterium]